jgi:orotate phosphoribosyltransferase-like protein
MLTVETIRKIWLLIHRDGKSIRQTAKELRLSRNTVRKVVRTQQTAFECRRRRQPRPALGLFVERLDVTTERKLTHPPTINGPHDRCHG